MAQDDAARISLELTTAEAQLVIAALQRFEPYWPSSLDDLSRAELLAKMRHEIEHVVQALKAGAPSS